MKVLFIGGIGTSSAGVSKKVLEGSFIFLTGAANTILPGNREGNCF
jgi:hypothetical protein